MTAVTFFAMLDTGGPDAIERGGFADWPDAVKVAKEHAEQSQTTATVWARWAGRSEIMFEIDGRDNARRNVRLFAPWSWQGLGRPARPADNRTVG